MAKRPPATAPLAARQEPQGQTEFTYKLAYVITFSSEINAGKRTLCSYLESPVNRGVESRGASSFRMRSDFAILFVSRGADGGDRGPPDLLTVLPNPEFPKKSHDLIRAARNTLPSVLIEQGCPNLRQNDPQRPPHHMRVEPAEVTAVSSFRAGQPGSLPAVSYQTYGITEAAQVLAAIIHPRCIDPVGLVGMQHTLQGNFFLLWCFKLALPRAVTSWVSCLLGQAWQVPVAGDGPLSDLPNQQP